VPDPAVRFTGHAVGQAELRQLDIDEVLAVVRSPEQIVPVREFRQSLVNDGRHVIRVLVDLADEEVVVVTMYRTSKVDKYWRPTNIR
jgi:hypothetical protein